MQFRHGVDVMKETLPFVRENLLWNGLFENKWVTAFVFIVSILFTYHIFKDINQLMALVNDTEIMQAGLIAGMDNISHTISEQSKTALSTGGSKYLFIILLEVIIFSFTVKTFSILTHQKIELGFKEFVEAEKRMIIVMVRNFVKAILAQVVIYILLSILSWTHMTSFFMFFVYSYFMGYAFLDNYNEQFKKSIKSSENIIQQHVGASTAFGLAASILLYVPVIGPVLTPILGAVAATLYGHRYRIDKIGKLT